MAAAYMQGYYSGIVLAIYCYSCPASESSNYTFNPPYPGCIDDLMTSLTNAGFVDRKLANAGFLNRKRGNHFGRLP